jgi:hypothetical protein
MGYLKYFIFSSETFREIFGFTTLFRIPKMCKKNYLYFNVCPFPFIWNLNPKHVNVFTPSEIYYFRYKSIITYSRQPILHYCWTRRQQRKVNAGPGETIVEIVTQRSVVVEYQRFRDLHPEDGSSIDLWSVGILPQHTRRHNPEDVDLNDYRN